MSDIKRLLRVAADRNNAKEYSPFRVRLLKVQIKALKEKLAEDGMSASVLFEAVIRGYTNNHHSVLAMIDQWKRDENVNSEKHLKKLSSRDLDDIYSEIGGNSFSEE